MARETPHRWLIPLLAMLLLAGLGAVAWASRTATALETKIDATAKTAETAHALATKDHDAITRLEVLVPRLEQVVNKLEGKPAK